MCIRDSNTGAGDDVIRNVLATDIVNAGAGSDTVYISYTTLDPNISVSIDGGSETSDFDWIICDLAPNSEKDFTLCRTAFVNFEGYDFTDGEKQTITLDSDDFVSINSQTLKIKGDSNDEISLPQDAVQTSSDDLYLYYTLNDVEIGISTDLMIIQNSIMELFDQLTEDHIDFIKDQKVFLVATGVAEGTINLSPKGLDLSLIHI